MYDHGTPREPLAAIQSDHVDQTRVNKDKCKAASSSGKPRKIKSDHYNVVKIKEL